MEVKKEKSENKYSITKILVLIISPLTVIAVVLFAFYRQGLFPFGKGSIMWCDMAQQVVPLMCDLKDLLTGKTGIFLNLQNAGGMNMWGVIFFFLASPLNLSVLFVDKENFIYLVNILLVAKLALSAFTAALYFRKCHKNLHPEFVWLLSTSYGLCGFGMIMYQNIIWLDIMYLFPLLLTGLNKLFNEKKILVYTISITAVIIMNYYIGFMIVLYILLFMGIFTYIYSEDKKYREAGCKFLTGSLLGAFLSAVVWIPCFMQYLSSGRGGFNTQFDKCGFFDSYRDTSAQLLCTSFIFAVVLVGICLGGKRNRRFNGYLLLAFLTIIPMYIEPVNLMWHMGSYMAFPGRYGFITIFSVIICAGFFLSEFAPDTKAKQIVYMKEKIQSPEIKKKRFSPDNISSLPALITGWCLVYAVCRFGTKFIEKNYKDITSYTWSLYQNENSYRLLMEIFFVMFSVSVVLIILYKKGALKRTAFVTMAGVMLIAESYGNAQVYLTSTYRNKPYRTDNYIKNMELNNKIQDDGFYRVKTSSKIFDVNLPGAMGYRTMGHYTSLTSKDYMYMAKLMGYSSYWMEVGSHGGTEISDALMGVKYQIKNTNYEPSADYSTSDYEIFRQNYALPLGIITKSDLSDCESLQGLTRQQVQQTIYDKLISSEDKGVITGYDYTDTQGVRIKKDKNNRVKITLSSEEGYIDYRLDVFGRQSLYFDCFDKLSSDLYEHINDSFDISLEEFNIEDNYPSQGSNGLLYLGTFENQTVNIKIKVNKNIDCYSFGIFGVNRDKVTDAVKNVKTAGLNEKAGKISGTVNAEKGDKCVISVPYSKDLKVTVNGEKVRVNKTLEDLFYIDLQDGENKIEITCLPKTFVVGLVVTIIGIGLCVLYKLKGDKIKFPETVCRVVNGFVITAGAMVLFVIYVAPVIFKLTKSI